MNDKILKIAIAGASGFVGGRLIESLLSSTHHNILALSRFPTEKKGERLHWQECDLYSLLEIEEALKGVDVAFYLVHSRFPSANLDQGNFMDYDLLLADNFARAAEKNQVKQVIFLGALIPASLPQHYSAYLESKLEIEKVFSGKSFALTVLRAGPILGREGVTFRAMIGLVRRFPLMICPPWMDNTLSPIFMDDLLQALKMVIHNPIHYSMTYDLVGDKQMSFLSMIKKIASAMGKKRYYLQLPFEWPRFFYLIMKAIGLSKEMVLPLIDSIKIGILPEKERILPLNSVKKFDEGLMQILQTPNSYRKRSFLRRNYRYVRSVQRIPLPASMNAMGAAEEYMKWMPQFMYPVFFVKVQNELVTFAIFSPRIHLLYLKYSRERSTSDRALFYVTGGLLSKVTQKGRLEFREIFTGRGDRSLITAIHDFAPTLPWPIYRLSQAMVHLWVMYSFGRHLSRLKEKEH